jgi:hypothetical protein
MNYTKTENTAETENKVNDDVQQTEVDEMGNYTDQAKPEETPKPVSLLEEKCPEGQQFNRATGECE